MKKNKPMLNVTKLSRNDVPVIVDNKLSKIGVSNFKSFNRLSCIDLAPLTILCGANSSGKSSIIQPLLLLKQTLEVIFDPGIFFLNGPNIPMNSIGQVLWRSLDKQSDSSTERLFTFLLAQGKYSIELTYSYNTRKADLRIFSMVFGEKKKITWKENEFPKDPKMGIEMFDSFIKIFLENPNSAKMLSIVRERCYLTYGLKSSSKDHGYIFSEFTPFEFFSKIIRNVIHVPGLRGNPARYYSVTGTGPTFPGLFPNYVGSIIEKWQRTKDVVNLSALRENLLTLGLTWKVDVKKINDAQLEINVGRTYKPRRGGSRDVVSIADVGFGVSQSLPVIVALLVANNNHIVYIEQPEIHLHPIAQVKLARLIVDAIVRGVQVIVETHSQFLLLGIQNQMASRNDLKDKDIILHWFERGESGETSINSVYPSDDGTYGDWPEDFTDTSLDIQYRLIKSSSIKNKTK